MRSNYVFQHAANGEHANLERLLSVPRLIFRKLTFKDPNYDHAENAGDHKHHRVPGDRILRSVNTKHSVRSRAKFREEFRPERVGVVHLKPIRPLAKVMIDELHDDRRLLGLFLCVCGSFL